jgi:hypothetical protein
MPVPWSFETAFDRLYPRAEELARGVVGDPVAAEDVAIDALAAAYRRWDRMAGRHDLDEWVLALAAELAAKMGASPSIEPDAPRRTPHQLLELVVDRAERRGRRRAVTVTALAAAAAIAIVLAVVLTSSSSDRVVTVVPPTTDIPLASPALGQSPPPTETSTSAVTTVASVVRTTPSGSTASSIACRNSSDPRCGAFRWDPAPGSNQPLDIQLTYEPADPHPGDVVTFTARVVDPDASPITAGEESCNPPSYGDRAASRCAPPCPAPGYGPWTPPPRKRGERSVTYSHTYAQAGTFTASFWFGSAGGCASNPYASAAESAVVINVS